MSSMRNAVQRRPHRERAQPLERRRLGLLEKHKVSPPLPPSPEKKRETCSQTVEQQDYSLRAKDHNKKKSQLKALRAKATERNDDEFYFGMLTRRGPGQKITSDSGKKWDGTARGTREGNAGSMSVEAARLLKTQDLGYVRTMRQVARKEVARLEERVVLARGFDRLDEDDDDGEGSEEMEGDDEFDIDFGASSSKPPKAPRKIVFLDDEDEREGLLDAQDDLADSSSGKPSGGEKKETEDEAFQRAVQLRRLRKKLDNERRKLSVLAEAEAELELERARMAKTATSAGVTRRGKKLKVRTRKR